MPKIYRPVLLVEGHGDQIAVPVLVRKLLAERGLHEIVPAPRPIKTSEISRLRRTGQLEKFVCYGCLRDDGDSVLLVLDCDDDCPVTVSREFLARIKSIQPPLQKPVAIAFLKKEFECLFLACADSLAAQYPGYEWNFHAFDTTQNMEEIRAAKAELNQLMRKHTYKETRDQPRFAAALDITVLRHRSRSFQHLESIIEWMAGLRHPGANVYPVR